MFQYLILNLRIETNERYFTQQKQNKMNQKVILTNKTTNKVSLRVFRSKKECAAFISNWSNTYTFKVLTTF